MYSYDFHYSFQSGFEHTNWFFRPAYMDEYDKLEAELQRMYGLYVQKYRNLCYLEHVQSDYDKAEFERNNVNYMLQTKSV